MGGNQEGPSEEDRNMEGSGAGEEDEEEEETPHARGPEESGVGDTGPQAPTTSHMGEDGVEMQGIDVAAALGRRQEDDEVTHPSTAAAAATGETTPEEDTDMRSPGADSTGTKREAEQPLEGASPKKLKESDADDVDDDNDDAKSTTVREGDNTADEQAASSDDTHSAATLEKDDGWTIVSDPADTARSDAMDEEP